MTTEDAKAYLAGREIPQLFESLMTGLMYYRPEDHITYLQECLRKVQKDGVDAVRWNLFIQQRLKTPLPPITPENGRGSRQMDRDPSFITEPALPASLENRKGSPLPPIGRSFGASPAHPDRMTLPNCPIVVVMGGPGCGKATQCQRLTERYPGWVHLSMGDLLRHNIMKRGSVDDKWDMVSNLVQQGEMAPEDMTLDLIKAQLQQQDKASGIIIEGFPRTMQQIAEYDRYIGRVDMVFMLDCEEQYLQQRLLSRGADTGRVDDNINAVAARISFFKEHTLPAIKHFDDQGKLVVIEGDRDSEVIFYDLAMLFDATFYAGGHGGQAAAQTMPRPPSTQKPASPRPGSTRYSRPSSKVQHSRPGSGINNVSVKVDISVPDTGRKEDLPKCPIIMVMGGPGSGRGTQCKRLLERYSGFVHLSMGDILRHEIAQKGDADDKWGMVTQLVSEGNMAPQELTIELVLESLRKHMDAKAIILEGFPRTKEQLEEFNTFIGGVDLVIVLDCEEYYMQKRLTDRGAEVGRIDDNLHAIGRRIAFYKNSTLPVIGHFDDMGKLVVVNGDRDSDEIFFDMSTVVDQALFGSAPPAETVASTNTTTTATVTKVESLDVSTPDTGRLPNLPSCPIISVVGSPGSGHDAQCKKLTQKYSSFVHIPVGENDTVSSLVSQHSDAKAILLEGYPQNKHQLEEFNKTVGGLDCVIVVDCDEQFARQKAGSRAGDIDSYKQNTLPVLGYLDDFRRLEYVRGQQSEDEVFEDVTRIVDSVLDRPRPEAEFCVTVPDTGRREGLPATHVIAVIGAPKSKSDVYCKKATEKYAGSVHISAEGLSADDLVQTLKQSKDATAIFLENFPSNQSQLEAFNSMVGGMRGAIVIDTTEDYVRSAGADSAALEAYRTNTLPILSYYDDFRKLDVIKGERDEEEVFGDVCKTLDDLLKVAAG